MKSKLVALLNLFLSSTLLAANTITVAVEPKEPLEDKVVELHITFAPPPSAEVKKQRKTLARTKTGKAICSGSFISPFGHILTARHCVANTTEIDVVTSDMQEYRANIVAISAGQDLAVIQIGRIPSPFFRIAAATVKGEPVSIIGSPFGLTGLLTQGIVSKLGGDINFLDCTAIPGNSGGPVINANGELAGVVSAMVMVFAGPGHISVVQSVDSIRFFFYELTTGKYNGRQ